MAKTHGTDEYLEAVYVLQTEGETVLSSRLADFLRVARPTVTQTVQRLTAQGLIETIGTRELTLTEAGQKRAESVLRRHRLLERWLTDELGLDWADAHVEAARLEHSISPLVEQRLADKLGNPTTCPHGNVIPGSGIKQPMGMPLSEVQAPATAIVVRIVELAEEDLELLRFLHRAGMVPGADIVIDGSRSPYEAGIAVRVSGQKYSLDEQVARRVLVHVSAALANG